MSETVPEAISQEERVSRMRDLLGHAAENGFSNVDVLGGFIDYYEECRDLPGEERTAFYEQLDFPEHGIEFGDGTFDDIVAKYDELGGVPRWKLRGEMEMGPQPADEPAEEPDPTAALKSFGTGRLRDGDLVLRQEQLAGRSPEDVKTLIKKVGEMGFSLARFTTVRPDESTVFLRPHDPETQPSLGTVRREELWRFLESAGASRLVLGKADKLLFRMNYAALHPDEREVFPPIDSERKALLLWEEDRTAYDSAFQPYPGHHPLLIDLDELEWHMRRTDFYRSYRDVGPKTVSAVNSFVNTQIAKVTAPKV